MTKTLTPHQRALRSTVLMKVIMAVSGLCLVGFLLMHMYGNLKMFLGQNAFDHYAHFLKKDLLYPIVPKGWFIWIFRGFLLICLVAHMYCAIKLSLRSIKARGPKYQKTKRLAETYSARTMRIGGVILFLFIIFHILQFTARVITPGFDKYEPSPYVMVVLSFSLWWMVVLYGLCMILICMHVRHGFWSAFTTLGGNTSVNARRVINVLAYIVALAMFVGFMIMPVAVLIGVITI